MKRYLVFAGFNYYPSGGWDDFVDAFSTLEEAQASAISCQSRGESGGSFDWVQIVDCETRDKIIENG